MTQANSLQLYAILHELSNTTFFNFMQINMEGKCKFWDGAPEKKCNKTLPTTSGDSEDVEGGGGNLPQAKKACGLDLSGGKFKAPQVNKPPPGMLGGFSPPPTPPAASTATALTDDNVRNTLQVRSFVCA